VYQANFDFYSTAAQVIPLLFITLAIDLRGFVVSPLDVKLPAWKSTREEHEPRLVAVDAEHKIAVRKAELRRELTAEEQIAIWAEMTKKVAADWDRTERSLKDSVNLSQLIAAVSSVTAMLALIFGEAIALRVLEVGHGTRTASAIVETALWLGAGLLAWRLVERLVDAVIATEAWGMRRR
jgi:hypothetical protein